MKEKKKREKLQGFVIEFKTFISRGSVMDLAVGLIVGAAFTAIINSLIGDIVMPLLGLVIGGIDFSGLAFSIPGIFKNHTITVTYGNFIQSVIKFLAISLCVFMFIKAINKLRDSRPAKSEETDEAVKEETAGAKPAEILLLEEIRDLLKSDKL
ncbi:MAG: large-conductance mechanosensitive channel protein MscL [Eubacterium sp.]|jgi:large conductance mechanosensitive channel|nr:large-conductance mechanosensitive channel protein MscL [Eubacterium sp.]